MFRFTIRDVLWLTVLMAVGVAWWLDRCAANAIADHQQHKFLALERLIREGGHSVEYDGDMPVRIAMFMHLRELPGSSPAR
jgi:hypothetical protein